jgi:hypothetical protein
MGLVEEEMQTHTRSNYLGPDVEVADTLEADGKFFLWPFPLQRMLVEVKYR